MTEPQVVLSPRGVERILSGHYWVYRSDIRSTGDVGPGETVRLRDERGRFLGKAWFSTHSQITIRLITREDRPIDTSYVTERLDAATRLRERVVNGTNAYRLVYGESDGLPSLIVDRYADILVLQTLSQATERRKDEIVRLLNERFQPRAIVERNDPRVRRLEGLPQQVGVLTGTLDGEVVTEESGLRFASDLLIGQKTGAFLDQRENRAAFAAYACGEVMDCFCYTGGFALHAARVAERVEAVDLSAVAVATTRRNAELNGLFNVVGREANAFDLLKEYSEAGRRFDAIALDPPAFAKSRANLEAARRGYKEINLRALKLLRPGGILLTCSCSHHVSEALLLEIVAKAALDVHRKVVILERRAQSRDHPILLTLPETHYLKCLILMVE